MVHQGALGDFVVVWSVLRAMAHCLGPLDILTWFSFGRLAVDLGIAAGHLPIEAEWVASLYGQALHPLARRYIERYDRAVVFSNNAALVGSLARIVNGPVTTVAPRPPADRSIHVRDHVMAQLDRAGLVLEPFLGKATARSVAPGATVWLHPGAGSARKRWPLAYFVALSEQLAGDGFVPAFVVGPAEAGLSGDLAALVGTRFAVHRPEGVGVLATLLSGGAAFIGNDGGPTHLAAALGLATVAVFGPSDPVRWIPVGPAVAVVRPEMSCRPCFETAPANCADPLCLSRTTVADVLSAFKALAD